MIRILGNISGILCAIIFFLNFLSYFFKYIYIKINNINLKKSINTILPIISKYDSYLIIICFISLLIHISCFFINVEFLSIVIIFNVNIMPKSTYNCFKKISSYIIIFFIIFHIFIYI